MSLNIKNEHVHSLVREAARRTGHSQTQVVEDAVTCYIQRLDRVDASHSDRVVELIDDFHQRLSPEEKAALSSADLYDESGLPA